MKKKAESLLKIKMPTANLHSVANSNCLPRKLFFSYTSSVSKYLSSLIFFTTLTIHFVQKNMQIALFCLPDAF
jgi:hypothetical protein